MLEISKIENNPQYYIDGLKKRNINNAEEIINEVVNINIERRSLQNKYDNILSQMNIISKQIGNSLDFNNENIRSKINETKELKIQSNELKHQLNDIKVLLRDKLSNIPNVPYEKIKVGLNSNDNVIEYENDIYLQGNFINKDVPHWEIAKQFDIIDFELGNKLTGAGFPVYKNKGAKLQRALINFFLDEASKQGFKEMEVPILVNYDSVFATGQLPDKEEQMYNSENFYLIPTAEVPLTNIYRNEIINYNELPIKLTGYTPCFRREAGSWGSNVRGLNRLHQFDKIEIVSIVEPDQSYQVLHNMKEYVKSLVEKLGLPYHVLELCTGDLGFNATCTYDIEVFSTGQNKWLESSSVSNFESYQTNRLNLKIRDKDGKLHLAHTLNGSALALPRIMAALLEFYYRKDKIMIPEILQQYTCFDHIE